MKHLLLTALISSFIIQGNAQNVGIGTAAPSEKLHVNGNVRSDTIKVNGIKLPPDAGEGKILTSDASGNASWQESSRVAGNIGYGVWGDCATNANIGEFQPVADSVDRGDATGTSAAMSGNFAALGSPSDDVNGNAAQGSVNIYEFNGSNWVFKQKIFDPAGATADQFGFTVSMSGNYLAVSSLYDDVGTNMNEGSVVMYRYNGSSWVFMQKITDPGGEASDLFGSAIDL